MILLDTGVVIELRDGNLDTLAKAAEADDTFGISIISRIELEAGLVRRPDLRPEREARLNSLLADVRVFPVHFDELDAYVAILAHAGFSRRKLLDRLIAATALAQGLPLATLNPGDFADVVGLEVVDWR